MRKTTQHLDDEHMRLYEWSGAGTGCNVPPQSKCTRPWNAASSVLAVMTGLLILGGCTATRQAETASEQAARGNQNESGVAS